MAIFSEDFQGFAVGALSPFGSLATTGFFQSTIVDTNPVGIYGLPKSAGIGGISGLKYTNTGIYTAASSAFFGGYFTAWEHNILQLLSGATQIGLLQTNADGTISLLFGATRIATSELALNWYAWHWFQVNVTYTNDGGFVRITYDIAVDEVSYISGTYLSTMAVGSLPGLGVEAWEWTDRYNLARITLDTIQPIGTDPNPGTPEDRATQGTIEQAQVPDSALVRATQGTVEQAQLPDSALIRATQGVIELVIAPDDLAGTCPVDHDLTVNIPVELPILTSGGFEPFHFELTGGSLPPGLTLDEDTGIISGTPTTPGTYNYEITITDDIGFSVVIHCTFHVTSVAPGPPELCAERQGPKLYFWEPSFLERPEDTVLRATDWDDAGYKGLKFVQGFKLTADTENTVQQFKVRADQADVETFTITHNGQLTKAYALSTPVQAHLLQILPLFTNALWRLFEPIEWIFEPAPEYVLEWKTQGTDHDLPGYSFLKDIYIAHASTADITLNITIDGTLFTFTIPHSSGAYVKSYLLLALASTGRALKGKLFTYELKSAQGFQLYQKDCEVRVHSWAGGEYMVKLPFGDVSRINGARI